MRTPLPSSNASAPHLGLKCEQHHAAHHRRRERRRHHHDSGAVRRTCRAHQKGLCEQVRVSEEGMGLFCRCKLHTPRPPAGAAPFKCEEGTGSVMGYSGASLQGNHKPAVLRTPRLRPMHVEGIQTGLRRPLLASLVPPCPDLATPCPCAAPRPPLLRPKHPPHLTGCEGKEQYEVGGVRPEEDRQGVQGVG